MGVSANPKAFTADGQILSAGAIYRGFAVRETAGSTAEIRIYDGTSTSGTFIGGTTLAANAQVTTIVDGGLWCAGGIYVDVVSGAVSGSIWIG